jgi:hypothetical protein
VRGQISHHLRCRQTERAPRGQLCYDASTSEMRRRSSAGPRLNAGAEGPQSGRSAWLVDRPSKRQVARHTSEGSGPGAAKSNSDQPAWHGGKAYPSARSLGVKPKGSPRHTFEGRGPETTERGVLCARQVKVAGHRAQAWNAPLLLPNPRAASRREAQGVSQRLDVPNRETSQRVMGAGLGLDQVPWPPSRPTFLPLRLGPVCRANPCARRTRPRPAPAEGRRRRTASRRLVY